MIHFNNITPENIKLIYVTCTDVTIDSDASKR